MTLEAEREISKAQEATWPEEGSIKFFDEGLLESSLKELSQLHRSIILVNSGLYGLPLSDRETGKQFVPPIPPSKVAQLREEALAEKPELRALFDVKAEYGFKEEEKEKDEEKPTRDFAKDTTTDNQLSSYLTRIGKIRLLTKEEEVELGQKMEKGKKAEKELEKNQNNKDEEELKRDIAQGKEAREALTVHNLRLVASVAKKYRGRGMDFEDIISEGNVGLMRAVDKFDYKRGFRFSTYAYHWIVQAILRGIADKGNAIRWPIHFNDSLLHVTNTEGYLYEMLGRKPEAEEIQAELKARGTEYGLEKIKDMRRILSQQKSPDSLNNPAKSPSGEMEFIELISDDEVFGRTSNRAEESIIRDQLEGALGGLSIREQKVLRLRYGLEDGRERNLSEIGIELGVTRERIRQIEKEALRKLRAPHLNLRELLEELMSGR